MSQRSTPRKRKPSASTGGTKSPASAPPEVSAQPKAATESRIWAAFLERLCLAIDAHGIVAATDDSGRITYANDRFCEISGYTRDELIGQNHRIIKSHVHPPEFFRDLWRTISSGHIWRGKICNRAKSGRLYWVDSTIVPFVDAQKRPLQYIALRTDITHLKEVEEALNKLTHDLEHRVEERTHELEQLNAQLHVEMENRMRAAEKLAKSERLYRFLFQSITDYFYTVEVSEGRAVRTNHSPGCLQVTGYSPEDLQRESLLWIKMVVPEDRPAVEQQAREALTGHTPPPLEHRIVTKEGEVRWIRNTVVVRRDDNGQVAFYDGIITDVTAQREAQEKVARLNQELEQRVADRTAQLKASSEQFRLIFEHAPVGISWVEWGPPDRYHLNDRFCQIIGLSREEAMDFENLMRATHPDDREKQRALMREVKAGMRDRFTLEKRYIHKDGRTVWTNLTVVVLRDAQGGIIQQFAMIEDTTERREAEERLRRGEQRFRRFVENASEILYSLNAAGRLLYVSPIWTAKLGHAVTEVAGRQMTDFIHPDDAAAFKAFLDVVLKFGRSTLSVEYRALHKDGRYRWHASSGGIYHDEAGERRFMGVARDVTERKRNQEELRAALAAREELARIIHRSPSVVMLWRASESEGWPVEYVSQNIKQYGYEPEELVSGRLTFLEIIHPADRNRVADEVRGHATARHREYTQEYRILARDGSTHWISDRTLVRVDANARVTHHEGILTDITARKEAEQREAELRERELNIARQVQQHLLPSRTPTADLDVQSLYIPSQHIGGDYYDFFEVGPRQWAFLVADVSGKGPPAALVMAACRMAVHIEARRNPSPAALLRVVNRILHPDMPEGMFISMVYGVLDLDTCALALARAGHEAPLVVRGGDGSAELPCPSGLALGLDSGDIFDEVLEEQTVQLGPNDLFVFYTDGITETLNETESEEFGRDRLLATVAACRTRPAAQITQAIEEALEAYAAGHAPHDDRTLVVVRVP